jgi:hypothetical protein
VTVPCAFAAYPRSMDEARRVLARLERIERLRDAGGPRVVVLAEVRKLLEEGEAWIAAEPAGTERAASALDACRGRLDEPVPRASPDAA